MRSRNRISHLNDTVGRVCSWMAVLMQWFKKWRIGSVNLWSQCPQPDYADVGLEHLRIGLTSSGKVTEGAAQSLAHLTQTIAGAGGTLVVPANASFLTSPA